MTDEQFRDFCAASALGGLIAHADEDSEDLRHQFHRFALEAFRAADEMVEVRARRKRAAKAESER